MSESFFWHDYETWGADPFRDRAAQFAGLRTDLEFNVIGEPLVQYCRPADDFLPSPEACLVTGITPQKALAEGVAEVDFIAAIHEQMAQPGTCTVGYNNVRFDDEVTRHTLYRNFYDPYAREWQQGNSRWDLIDVVRLAHALRPEGINWPRGDDGNVSFRLELLTEANEIKHTAAHDAMSDVYATIAMAKLLRNKQPRLYNYAFSHRDKKSLRKLIDISNRKPLFHVSSKYPARLGCCAVVVPLARHPVNPNGVIVCDLRVDPATWVHLSTEEIKARLFVARDQLPEGVERVPVKVVHLNKCPILVETKILKTVSPERLQQFELDGDKLRKHLQYIRKAEGLKEKLTALFKPEEESPRSEEELLGSEEQETHSGDICIDPDTMLYSGGFFSRSDSKNMTSLREKTPDDLAGLNLQFEDRRIPEMLFRYRARNFPDTLNETEMQRWEDYRYQQLTGGSLVSYKAYFETLASLARNADISDNQKSVLLDLKMYAESIIPAD